MAAGESSPNHIRSESPPEKGRNVNSYSRMQCPTAPFHKQSGSTWFFLARVLNVWPGSPDGKSPTGVDIMSSSIGFVPNFRGWIGFLTHRVFFMGLIYLLDLARVLALLFCSFSRFDIHRIVSVQGHLESLGTPQVTQSIKRQTPEPLIGPRAANPHCWLVRRSAQR